MTPLFDGLLHLELEAFAADRAQVLEEARGAGVTDWFVPLCREEHWVEAPRYASLEGVHLGLGLHPWWVREVSDIDVAMSRLSGALRAAGARALGECGLDRARASEAPLELQIPVFEAQVRLAGELELPLVIHVVRALPELLRSLERVGEPRAGVFVHGFSGDARTAQELTRRGFFLGVGPAITRPRREKLHAALRAVPLEHLLLETDAPDQRLGGPERTDPRGLPRDLVEVACALARIRGEPLDRVSAETSRNARRFFLDEGPGCS